MTDPQTILINLMVLTLQVKKFITSQSEKAKT